MLKRHWRYLLHKEGNSRDSTTWFRVWQFQTPDKKFYFQMHILTERFVFEYDIRGFLGDWVKMYPMAPVPLLTHQLASVLTSIVCGQCWHNDAFWTNRSLQSCLSEFFVQLDWFWIGTVQAGFDGAPLYTFSNWNDFRYNFINFCVEAGDGLQLIVWYKRWFSLDYRSSFLYRACLSRLVSKFYDPLGPPKADRKTWFTWTRPNDQTICLFGCVGVPSIRRSSSGLFTLNPPPPPLPPPMPRSRTVHQT